MMKPFLAALMAAALIAPAALAVAASAAGAGPIEQACLRADRAGSAAVCGCIQQAADMTLRSGDQRRAAKFFADPDQAQKVRMSTTNGDNAFWDRYKNFGATAEAFLRRLKGRLGRSEGCFQRKAAVSGRRGRAPRG